MITAEEFFRNKIKKKNPNIEVVTLSRELITAEEGMRWAHEFKQLQQHGVAQGLPYYQLCPKCFGEGYVPSIGTTSSLHRICPVCNGAKTIYHALSGSPAVNTH